MYFGGESAFDPTANETDIFYCFRLILGRLPNKEEWTGHSSVTGQNLATVVAPYFNSLEFAQRGILNPPSMDDVQLVKLDKFSMYVSPSDLAVGRQIMDSKSYEPNVARILHQRLRLGMTVLDVGANIGYFSLLASSLIGSDGQCIAIEPNSRNVKLLLASKESNGFQQLQILQAAAGDTWGVLQLNTMHSNGVVSPVNADIRDIIQRETVLSLRIDDVLSPRVKIDVIKIDVEGAEYRALSGALQHIEKDRPLIISEFTPGSLPGISGVSPEEYLRFFTERGYHLSVLEPDRRVDCGQDVAMVMRKYRERNVDHIDILADLAK